MTSIYQRWLGQSPWELLPTFWRGGIWRKGWYNLKVWTILLRSLTVTCGNLCFRLLQLMWVKRQKCVASRTVLHWGMEARWSDSWFPLKRNPGKFWWPLRCFRKMRLILCLNKRQVWIIRGDIGLEANLIWASTRLGKRLTTQRLSEARLNVLVWNPML